LCVCPNQRRTQRLLHRAFNGNLKLPLQAASCKGGKKAVVPTTEQKLLPPSSRNSATCFQKRQGWFLYCKPSSMGLGTRSRGPLSTARLPEVRSTRKATSIC